MKRSVGFNLSRLSSHLLSEAGKGVKKRGGKVYLVILGNVYVWSVCMSGCWLPVCPEQLQLTGNAWGLRVHIEAEFGRDAIAPLMILFPHIRPISWFEASRPGFERRPILQVVKYFCTYPVCIKYFKFSIASLNTLLES